MRKIKKTDSKILISENNQNKILETFISMKFDAECNETILDIVLYRFHEDYDILTKMTSKNRPMSSQIFKLNKKIKDRYGISDL